MHNHSSRLLLFVVAAAADAAVGIYVNDVQKKPPSYVQFNQTYRKTMKTLADLF